MKRNLAFVLVFLLGAALTFIIIKQTQKDNTKEASTTIAYGISKLNKMVVAEQTYANFYSHKNKVSYLGDLVSFDKNLLLKVEVKAQASYDLSQLEVEIDSAHQTIYIKKIPPLKVETYPDVEFFEMEQSKLNQFTSNEINEIKKRAIKEVKKSINMTSLKKEAHEQLIENLENIYLLAKVYHWKIIDETPLAPELNDRIKF